MLVYGMKFDMVSVSVLLLLIINSLIQSIPKYVLKMRQIKTYAIPYFIWLYYYFTYDLGNSNWLFSIVTVW